jgi:hypothetical protein
VIRYAIHFRFTYQVQIPEPDQSRAAIRNEAPLAFDEAPLAFEGLGSVPPEFQPYVHYAAGEKNSK